MPQSDSATLRPRVFAPHRIEAWLLGSAVAVVAVTAVVAGAAATPPFSWRHSMISDLGARSCIVRAGVPMCSPQAAWLDAGLTTAGALLLAAAARAARRWDRAMLAGIVCLGTGLVVLGVCPSDRSHGVHMAGAVLALPACAACLLVSGLTDRQAVRGQRRRRCALGALALLTCLVHLVPDAVPVPRAVAEIVSVVSIGAVIATEIACSWQTRDHAPR